LGFGAPLTTQNGILGLKIKNGKKSIPYPKVEIDPVLKMTVIFAIGFYGELWTLVFLEELYHLTRGQHLVLHADSHRQWLSACQNRPFVAFT